MDETLFKKPNYRIARVARLLDEGLSCTYRRAASGELPTVKIGAGLRVNRNDLLAYLRKTGLEVDPSVREDRS